MSGTRLSARWCAMQNVHDTTKSRKGTPFELLFLSVKKCQFCGKKATMFLTQIVSDEVTELALCERCAKERGFFDPQTLTFAEKFFPSLIQEKVQNMIRALSPGQTEKPEQPRTDVLSRCPICSYTSEDYTKTERVGCPHCYSVFAEDFSPEVQHKLHLSDTSKTGDDISAQAVPNVGKKELELRMQKAIEEENYELAAQLRDQIKSMP